MYSSPFDPENALSGLLGAVKSPRNFAGAILLWEKHRKGIFELLSLVRVCSRTRFGPDNLKSHDPILVEFACPQL